MLSRMILDLAPVQNRYQWEMLFFFCFYFSNCNRHKQWNVRTLLVWIQEWTQYENCPCKIQNDILLAMHQRKVVMLLLLDLSAAFDTVVNHDILLHPLEH